MKILGLDWGKARIGVAVLDTEYRAILPRELLPNTETALQTLAKWCEEEQVARVVVGRPLRLDGTASHSTEGAEDFAAILGGILPCPVELIDERYTSQMADVRMEHFSKAQKTTSRDSLSAMQILETWQQKNP